MRFAPNLVALFAAAPLAASPFGDVAPVAEAELASMRGGFVLPNGLDLSVGIAIETRVNGQLALRTTVSTEDGLRVFVWDTSGMPAPTVSTPAASDGASVPAAPLLRIDRNGAGTVIAPVAAPPNVQIGVSRGPVADMTPAGATPVSVTPNGAPVDTAFGAVRLEEGPQGSMVILTDPTLQLRHLIGSATGVAVANTADNRAIDTIATVDIDLSNASVLIGSNLLRIDAIATDAASRNPL